MGDWYAVVIALVVALVVLQVTVPFTFTAGTIIDPDQMNTNLATLGNAILNRAGGTMTGNFAVQAGTTAAPGLASSADAGTGVRLTTAEIDLCVSAAAKMILTPTSASFYGNALINNTGKIPDLSTAYFTQISAGNFTSGVVPPIRLAAAGSPSATTFLRGDSAWVTLAPVPIVKSSGPYTTAVGEFVLCTGTFQVNLPTAVGNSGQIIDVKNMGTGVITIDANASETIDTALTYVLGVQFQSVTLLSDGLNWVVR